MKIKTRTMDLIIVSLMFYQLAISPAKAARMLAQDSQLQHFATFTDVMYTSTNHTIGSPCHLPLDTCAELCFKKSYHVTIRRRTLNHLAPYIYEKLRNSERGIRNTRSDRGDTCKAFEYIVSTGYCILLKKAAATDSQGYQSLKTASGTTYFELSKSVQDLYMKKNHVVFDGQDKYNNIISNISAEKCAYECINAPDLSCNSFVYSTSLHVCALSSHVASKNVHFKTTSFYDFYQYSGRWPCNVTLHWQYRPRVIASQMYPYAYHGNTSCHLKIIAPPGMKIVMLVKTFFTNKAINSGSDGLFIFDGDERAENMVESFCVKSDNMRHSSITSSNKSIAVKIVQQRNIVITRLIYDFSPVNCASAPCLFNGHCVETADSFECICPNGTSGKRCNEYVGDCYRKPCINGTCVPAGGTSGYQCTCFAGFTGANCEYNINECFSSPCINGLCKDLINDYTCICNDSYTGRHCEINKSLAECSSHICHYGACAVNESGSYCQCFPGFTGLSCDTDINDCNDSPCSHGKCIDHVNSYSCNCSTGYAGKNCEILVADPCRDNPCYHGYCSVNKNGFTCICESGFTGSRCEYETGLCLTECRNGKCFNVNGSSYPQCICYRGFTGTYCETNCENNTCSVDSTDTNVSMNKDGFTTTSKTGRYLSPLRYFFTSPSILPSFSVTRMQGHPNIPVTLTTRRKHYNLYQNVSKLPHNQIHKFTSLQPLQHTNNMISKTNGNTNSTMAVTMFVYATKSSGSKHRPSESSKAPTGYVQAINEIKTSTSVSRLSTYRTNKTGNDQTTIKTDPVPGTNDPLTTFKTTTPSGEYTDNFVTHLGLVTTTKPSVLNVFKTTRAYASSMAVSSNGHRLKTNFTNSTASTKHWLNTISLNTSASSPQLFQTNFSNTSSPTKTWLETFSPKNASSTKDWLNSAFLQSSAPIKYSVSTTPSMIASLIKHGLITSSPSPVSQTSHWFKTAGTLNQGKFDDISTSNVPYQISTEQKHAYIAASSHRETISPATILTTGDPTIQNTQRNYSDKMITSTAIDTTKSTKLNASKDTPTSIPETSFKNRKTTIKNWIAHFEKPNPTKHNETITTLNDKLTSTVMNMKGPVTSATHNQTMDIHGTSLRSFTITYNKLSVTKSTSSVDQQKHLSYVATTQESHKLGSSNAVTENDNTTDHGYVHVENTSTVATKGDTVSDVITVESVIIGALFVALILVVSVAVFMLYQRHRSGTLYITSPRHSMGRYITSVKDLYSERTNAADVRTRQELKPPRGVSSKLYDRQQNVRSSVYNISTRKVRTKLSPSSSSASTSPTSSRSDNYDDVESPNLALPTKIRRLVPRNRFVIKDRNVVDIARGDGVISPQGISRRMTNCDNKCLAGKMHQKESRLSSTNPFHRRGDGTVELSLSSKYKSHTQEEFEALLEEILNEEEYQHLRTPGKRKSIFNISGTDGGKSEA